MINLLPPEEKEKFLLEKKKRIIIILWALVLFFLVCLILILFSIKIYLRSQVESQRAFLIEAEKEFEQSEIQDLRKKISSVNLTLTKLNSFYQQKIYFSQILEKISQTLPSEAYLNNLSAVFSSDEEKGNVRVSLSGFVSTRETLFEFKKSLEKESNFKEISFPPANWVEPTDINFFTSFKVNI